MFVEVPDAGASIIVSDDVESLFVARPYAIGLFDESFHVVNPTLLFVR